MLNVVVGLVLLVSSFLSVEDFAEKYEIKPTSVYVFRLNNDVPDGVFVKESRYGLMVDENYFIKRDEFRKSVWLASHDMFHYFTEHIAESDLAYLLNKVDESVSINTWVSFLSTNLFRMDDSSILSFKISDNGWKFFRYVRWLIRAVFIKNGVPSNKRDLSIVLDNR